MAITVNLSNLDDTYFAVDPAGEIVNAFGGNDTLFSGSGNDTFNGGDGNDVAVYAFATSGVTVDLRITDPQDVGGGMGLDTLASIEGPGAQDAATMFGDRTSVMVKTGKTSHERWYNDSFTIGTGGDNTVKSADGHDQIFDFSLAEHDTLDFSGLGSMDQAKLAATFEIRHEHVNVEGNFVDSTVIALKGDDSFSVALVGVTDLSDADIFGAIHVS